MEAVVQWMDPLFVFKKLAALVSHSHLSVVRRLLRWAIYALPVTTALFIPVYYLVLRRLKPGTMAKFYYGALAMIIPIIKMVPVVGQNAAAPLEKMVGRYTKRVDAQMDNRSVTMPLAYATLNLHRGLHQVLYEGYVQRSVGMAREHDAL